VAFSSQRLRAYKWEQEPTSRKTLIQETLIHREVAHADGEMKIYMSIPVAKFAFLWVGAEKKKKRKRGYRIVEFEALFCTPVFLGSCNGKMEPCNGKSHACNGKLHVTAAKRVKQKAL
jgi:hypothetical protein